MQFSKYSSTLSCNLRDVSLLLCNLPDSSFLSCNLHDRSFLIERLVYRDVVEAQSSFKRSYLRFTSAACGDFIGSNGIEKDRVPVPPGLVLGKWGERLV